MADNREDWFKHRGANRGSVSMVDPNTNGDEPRLVLTGGGSGARVVLAEVDAPGSLHYLLEAEGFQVVGCAADEEELGRVLRQDVRPDVVVLDADIIATASVVARDLAPAAHVIAIWPDDVQPPPGGERVSPRAVYEELGPAIRRHMDRRSVPVPLIALPDDAVGAGATASVTAAAGLASLGGSASVGVFARAASRMSVLSVTLVTAIVFTMGVSFALGGFRSSPTLGPPRLDAPGLSTDGGATGTADPLTGRVPVGVGNGPSGNKPSKSGNGPGNHQDSSGSLGGVVTTGTGDGGSSTPTDQTGGQGTGQGDQGGGGQGDQGGGQGDQGGQGGGQGGQGGGQGGQGGGQGGQGDHGGQGGGGQHGGGGQGDQGGDGEDDQGGQGDQDGDEQGDNDQGGGQGDQGGSQGDNDQGGSQGDNDQGGGQNSHGNPAPHGDGHGAHSDQPGQNAQGNQS
ncbi:MAG TPA: hypothetical protein VHW68_02475 [Actinomycetota bacterium]|nr:hypothetical protein [Actinomycetota bacterium]